MDDLTARVREAISGPVAAAGVYLEGVEVRPAGRRRLVRVNVDTDSGITLDEVAAVTRVVSTVLDESDVMGDRPYVLEVGSPGVSAPLTQPRHWTRAIGRLVRVVPVEGEPFVGRLRTVTPAAVTLEGDEGLNDIALTDVRQAVVQVELKRSKGDRDGH